MTRTITLATLLGGASLLAVLPAGAADVRAQLTPELIYEHCRAAGVGSETEGTFMLPGGSRITGTVLCTADDLVATAAPQRHRDDDEDDDHGGSRGEHHEDDDDEAGA